MNKRIRLIVLMASVVLFGCLLNYPMHSQAAHTGGIVPWEDMECIWPLADYEYSNVYLGTRGTVTKRLVGTTYTHWGQTYNYKVVGYDEAGRLSIISDVSAGSSEIDTYQYDSQGRLIRRNVYVGNNLCSWTVYTRNAQGQIIRSNSYNDRAPSGDGYFFMNYQYSGGKLVHIDMTSYVNGGSNGTIDFTYDAVGNMTSIISQYYTEVLEYDALGRLVSLSVYRGGQLGESRKFTYDQDGFITRIDHSSGIVYHFFYETVGIAAPVAPAPVTTDVSTGMIDGFDPVFYAQSYPDVVSAFGTDPAILYAHYLFFGKAEGRLACAGI